MHTTPREPKRSPAGGRTTYGRHVCTLLAVVGVLCGGGVLVLSCCPAWRPLPAVPPLPPAPPAVVLPSVVRVLLRSAPNATLDCAAGGTWIAEEDGRPRIVASGDGPWRVALTDDGQIAVNGSSLGVAEVQLHPFAGPLELEGRAYEGRFVLSVRDAAVRIYNEVEPEPYLRSVVASEMYARWPMNALMAQAVAARSYMLYTHARKGLLTLADMAYRGTLVRSRDTDLAVDLTQGVVMTYEGRPFSAYFHSTCGGGTASAATVFGAPSIAPLEGADCDWCRASPVYEWRVVVPESDIVRAVGREDVQSVQSVETLGAGPDGHATEVLVNGSVHMGADAFRSAVGPGKLRSTRFAAVRTSDGQGFEFRGRGWGHGVGLCQWGAYGMAEAGYTWQEILEHYYPGAQVERLE